MAEKYTLNAVHSPRHEYLQACDKQSLAPRRLAKNLEDLDLHDFSIGDSYAQALSIALQASATIATINLQSNRLSDKSMKALSDFLCANRHVHTIDLSHNTVTSKGIRLFDPVLHFSASTLTELHLAANSLRDRGIQQLCTSLKGNSVLKLLDVSKNNVSDAGATALGILLSTSSCEIRELCISWNNMRSQGAHMLLTGVEKNKRLRTIDLSWNGMGSGLNEPLVVELLCHVLTKSKLLHVNVARNSFTHEALEKIHDAMLSSKHLVSLHMEPKTSSEISLVDYENGGYSRIRGHDLLPETTWEYSKHCWMCEHWNIQTFSFIPQGSVSEINLCLSLDNWRAKKMISQEDGSFCFTALVPPGVYQYYFQLDGVATCAPDQLSEKTDSKSGLEIVNRVSIVPASGIYNKETGWDFDHQHSILQRNKKASVEIRKTISVGRWDVQKSIFSTYERTNHQDWVKAFTVDWNHCDFTCFLAPDDDLELTKCVLQDEYPKLFAIYRYHTAQPDHTAHLLLLWAEFYHLMKQCLIPDDQNCTMHDIECLCIRLQSKRKVNLPSRTLARFEWISILVHLAHQKYKNQMSLSRSLRRLLSEHLYKYAKYEDPSTFRMEKFLRRETEAVYLKCTDRLKKTFQQYATQNYIHHKSVFLLHLSDYLHLLIAKEIVHHSSLKEASLCFALSASVLTDELNTTRHEQLSYYQWMECLGRLANKKKKNTEMGFEDRLLQLIEDLVQDNYAKD